MNRIAIKIGSNVLTRADGKLDITRMSALVDEIAALHRHGVEVVLVSSGAVASGRSILSVGKKLDEVDSRQLYSAVGQAKLINHYYELFREHGIAVGQVLTTKENFADRHHYLNQRNCIAVMLDSGIIPIINENDAVSVSELMFTDNDELAGLIASMMGVEALIILSNVDGIFDGNPRDAGSHLIREIEDETNISEFISAEKSQFGRGGMATKTAIARKTASQGIDVFIACGKRDNILASLVSDYKSVPCTHFAAAENEVSSVKKWIAHSRDFARASIYINANAAKILAENKVVSILPIGITRIDGEFEKHDLVKVFDAENHFIGIGKAQYGSLKAAQIIGQKKQKPLVHYDYLYLE